MKGIERQRVGPLPVWGWGVLSGLLLWGLYVFTLAPTTAFWDTSEYIATAHILGIPHPPGNPLFVIVGRVWDVLLEPTGLPVAVRINLLSATASAAAAVFWFLAVVRIWAHFTEDRRHLVVAGLVAVFVGGTAFTVWAQSNVNEKVYTVSLFVVALVTYLAMLWEDESGAARGDRIVILVAFLLGLGATNHQMSLLPLPALGLFVLWHDWRTLLRWKLVGVALLFAVIGFTVQLLFVPIRSAQNPVIDEANPECESLWDAVTPSVYENAVGETKLGVECRPLSDALNREQYGKPPLSERQAPLHAQYVNWWQYFDWQWARTLTRLPRAIATMCFLFFGLVGLWRHWQGDRDSFVYFATLLFTVTVVLVFYLNFRYGYSLYPDVPVDEHEVRERDYFYIVGFNLWGLYAGLGLVALWTELARRLRGEEGAAGWAVGSVGGLQASPLLLFALVPLVFNLGLADRRGDYAARDWAYNLLQSVEPYGILFTNGDNDTFPLWYLQEVEGIRKDVTVLVHSYLGTPWYPKQARALTEPCSEGVDPSESPTVIVCQRPFDAGNAVGPYRELEPTAPTRSILGLTNAQIDNLPPGIIMPEDTTLRISEWVDASARANDLVTYADLMVFLMARQALGDRPVYFASTAPPVYSRWRLAPHLLRQGLAHALVNGPLESTADTVFVGDALDIPWVDRVRSEALLWDVFQVAYLLDWDVWPEPSTRSSIPSQYYLAYAAVGLANEMRDMPAEAERAFRRGERLLMLAQPEE